MVIDAGAKPRVTVQLPLFNERGVSEQIIGAVAGLAYPKALLQIQVLDDSTDALSLEISRQTVRDYQGLGYDISLIHRDDREAFKAGALRDALPEAKAEIIVIFDADFLPEPDFLEKTIAFIQQPNVAFVQTRWTHINRDDSVLTQCQAIFLDSHFIIEHAARHAAGKWINFNGTAGLWNKQAILDAGNWQGDTLTEDVDLSYRAQLKDWRSIYLPDVTCPAQLPPEINAFKSQQHRWAKGSIQCAIKLLPTILRSKTAVGTKIEAFFHLTGPIVYVCATLLTLLLYHMIVYSIKPIESPLLGFAILFLAIGSATAYFFTSQLIQKKSFFKTLLYLPPLLAIGIAIALNNARGVIEACLNMKSDFIRTPKYHHDAAGAVARSKNIKNKIIPTPTIKAWMAMAEISLGIYMIASANHALNQSITSPTAPLLFLFALGYLYVGFSSLINTQKSRKKKVAA